jgi:hypothetical protein
MPHISEIRQSRFLSKADLINGPIVVTINEVHEEEIEFDGKVEPKFVMTFLEDAKPWILNPGNAQDISLWLGSEQTEDWHNRQIVIFHDPSVKMGGRLVGGIRTQAYNQNQALPQQPQYRAPVQQHRAPAPQHRPASPGAPRPAASLPRPAMPQHSNQAEYEAARAATRQQPPPQRAYQQPQPRVTQAYIPPAHQEHDAFDPNDGSQQEAPNFDQVGDDGAPR